MKIKWINVIKVRGLFIIRYNVEKLRLKKNGFEVVYIWGEFIIFLCIYFNS